MNKLLTIALMLIMSLCMASCGGDDEPEIPDAENASYSQLIIGSWSGFDDETVTFQRGGRGYSVDKTDNETKDFNWSITGTNLHVVYDSGTDAEEIESYTILSMNASVMVLKDQDDGEKLSMTRIK